MKAKGFLLAAAGFAVLARGAAGAVREQAAGEQPRATLIDGVAAYVNEHVITIAEVMAEVRGGAPADLSEAQLRDFYKAALDAMINRRLIIDAAKAAGATVAQWAVDQQVQEVINRRFGGDRAKLTAALASQRITPDEWRKILEEDLTVQLMRYNMVDRHVAVPGQAVRNFYTANTQLFVKATGVGVSVIVVAAADGASAADRGAQAIGELEAGKPFADVARAYSADSKARQGGDWGLIDPAETFRPELVAALAKLKAGEHSPLLLLEDHGYIVRKNSEAVSEPLTLEQAWPQVEARLKMTEAEKKYVDWINRLRRKAYIKVFELPVAAPAEPQR